MDTDTKLEELSFSVYGFIAKARTQVYEAVADPEQLSHYFTTGGARGRLESGATAQWDFHDFPGAFPVKVLQATAPEQIVLQWESGDAAASGDKMTTATFDFESVDDSTRTKVTITESGWHPTGAGAQAAFGNCMGWTGMLAALKAWLEHGINLREGFYK